MRFVHPQNFFDIFQNLGADGTGLADKIRTVTGSADDICIVTNSYGMHGSLTPMISQMMHLFRCSGEAS